MKSMKRSFWSRKEKKKQISFKKQMHEKYDEWDWWFGNGSLGPWHEEMRTSD